MTYKANPNYKLEAVHHKLEVTTAVDRVRKVSDSLEQTARNLPEPKKQEIMRTLEEAEASLAETQKEILTDEDDNQDI